MTKNNKKDATYGSIPKEIFWERAYTKLDNRDLKMGHSNFYAIFISYI